MIGFTIVSVTLDPVFETGFSGTSVKFTIVSVTLDLVFETGFSGTSVKLGVDCTTVIVSDRNSSIFCNCRIIDLLLHQWVQTSQNGSASTRDKKLDINENRQLFLFSSSIKAFIV
jgi:hypothetical protein